MFSFAKPLNRPIRDWTDQRVWIIGASSGIGEGFIENLVRTRRPCRPIGYRRVERWRVSRRLFECVALAMDVGDQSSWHQALSQLAEKLIELIWSFLCR